LVKDDFDTIQQGLQVGVHQVAFDKPHP